MSLNFKNKKAKPLLSALEYTLIILFWIAVWFLAARAAGEELLLPSPECVGGRMLEIIQTKEFWEVTFASLVRIVYGILSGILIGVILGLITSQIPFLYKLFRPIITVIRATPVASFIILAIIWIGRDTLPTFISALMVLPIVWGNVHEGVLSVDPKLCEVAKVYDFSFVKKVKRLYLPHVSSYFFAAVKTSIGLAWKAGIAAEILTLPPISIGKKLSDAKIYLETTDLFAWTVTVIVLSLLLELIFTYTLPKIYLLVRKRKERRYSYDKVCKP